MAQISERINIMFNKDDLVQIKDFCKKKGVSFSEFARKTLIKEIKEQEKMDLLKFINENCGFVEEDEEKEIVNFMKTYDETQAEFLEVSLNDILQD
ncbi:MAG: hypothetical protein ACRDAG_08450 [Cetobacterium somerae]|uniref:hypothetical protein n=1 Tax=Cetobacterium somerae TaxID=188913 RepID=UPI003F3EA931